MRLWPPLGVALAACVVASLGYSSAPLAAPLGMVAVAGGTWLAGWVLKDAEPDRRLALTAGVAWTLWLPVGWFAGPLVWPALVGLYLALAVTGGAWLLYLRSAGRPRLESLSMRQVLGPALEAWSAEHAANVKLEGVDIRLADATDDEAHMVASLTSKYEAKDVVAAVGRFEVALSRALRGRVPIPPDAIRFERDPRSAHLCHLYLRIRDPLAVERPYPGQSGTRFADPLRIGYFGAADDLRISLRRQGVGRNMLMAGVTGGGKSGALCVTTAELARPDVFLVGIDTVKHGDDLGLFGERFQRMAVTPEAAESLVAGLLRVQSARARWMAAEGLRDWPTSPEHPQIVLVIDEVTDLIEQIGSAKAIESLARTIRQQGMSLVMGTARVGAAAMGDSTGLLAHCRIRVGFPVEDRRDAAALFGTDRVAEGWESHRILGQAGSCLVWSPGEHEAPRPARTFWLTVDEIRAMVPGLVETMPALDEASRAALDGDRATTGAGVALLPRTRAGKRQVQADRLDELLRDAPGGRMEFAAIVTAMEPGMGRTTVYEQLRKRHRAAGDGWWEYGGGQGEG